MNWGNKLILIFLLFGGMIVYMVYRCMSTPVDLVAKEYYKDELAYQQVIDAAHNANNLSGEAAAIRQTDGTVMIQLPTAMRNKVITGDIYFYCPSDQKRDVHIKLQPDAAASQHIRIDLFQKGNYIIKINWRTEATNYFTERPFTIE